MTKEKVIKNDLETWKISWWETLQEKTVQQTSERAQYPQEAPSRAALPQVCGEWGKFSLPFSLLELYLIPLKVDVAALSEMDDKDLSELGLSNVNDRKAILKYVFKIKNPWNISIAEINVSSDIKLYRNVVLFVKYCSIWCCIIIFIHGIHWLFFLVFITKVPLCMTNCSLVDLFNFYYETFFKSITKMLKFRM